MVIRWLKKLLEVCGGKRLLFKGELLFEGKSFLILYHNSNNNNNEGDDDDDDDDDDVQMNEWICMSRPIMLSFSSFLSLAKKGHCQWF